ncbi:hypothetical protein ACHHYP_01795 [Achlya hypogyna]|uniref:Uncharacterized protein n=1 Tax=Achlya hypogyna TaxID=1202772 RepID=A0A1V9ZSZ3_ACHHY|nr:hypothetical protein ACHHYP_01795 [Achlya hypogyna]
MSLRRFSSSFRPFDAKTWDLLRPSTWHPLVSLEHSLHELKGFGRDKIMYAMPHLPSTTPSKSDETDFFQDLPTDSYVSVSSDSLPFANYSYSSAVVLDKKGTRVASVRRRYENSSGRLKATHAREIGDKRVLTKWDRANYEDKGSYETVCDGGSLDEFEKLWKETEFGAAAGSSDAETTPDPKKPEE